MKPIYRFAIITLLVSLTSCSGIQPEYTASWTKKSLETINTISGHYSLVSATWSMSIDLSGEGTANENILSQLNQYGWMGSQSIQYTGDTMGTSILTCSFVATPSSPNSLTQVDLYVPFPLGNRKTFDKQRPEKPCCSLDMKVYQYYYTLDNLGNIALIGVTDRKNAYGGTLQNVEVRFAEGGRLLFDADTSLYDWSTSCWQDGHMSLVFRRY